MNIDNFKKINKNRHKNIAWYNPPSCQLSNINIGKYFLRIISKNSKDGNSHSKVINKNNVKISYSCTNNISKIIDNHNKELINKINWNNKVNKNMHVIVKYKMNAPLENKCNLDNTEYQSNISTKENHNIDKTYIVITSLNWKLRYYNHLQSFRNPTFRN